MFLSLKELHKFDMIPGRERPLVVIYGSYETGINGNSCKQKLREIVQKGDDDSRLSDFQKGIVEDLPDHEMPPSTNAPEYRRWIFEKSNHYIISSDFNAFFILKGCINDTVWSEAEYALENNLEEKTIILLEKALNGDENSVSSLYNLERWNRMFDEIPIEFIDYEDYETAWNMIMGRLKSIYY